MGLMTAGAFDLAGNIDAPLRLENGAKNHEKRAHAQHAADN